MTMSAAHILWLCILGAALLHCGNANAATMAPDVVMAPDTTAMGLDPETMALNAGGMDPSECCSAFFPKRVNISKLRSYSMTDGRCAKAGVIVVTLNGSRICMDPSLSWVQRTLRVLDGRGF